VDDRIIYILINLQRESFVIADKEKKV